MTDNNKILIHPTLRAQVDQELKAFENVLAKVFGIEESQKFEEFKEKALTEAIVYVQVLKTSDGEGKSIGAADQAATDGDNKPNGAA